MRYVALTLLLVILSSLSSCESAETPSAVATGDVMVGDGTGGFSVLDVSASDVTTLPDSNDVALSDVRGSQVSDLGKACTENTDCESGWCVFSEAGYICTQACLSECPPGFGCKSATATGTDLVFLCLPAVQRLCEPCQEDVQCFGGTCEPIGGDPDRRFCTGECGADSSCREGYVCEAESNGIPRCVPKSGSCDCLPESIGLARSCSRENPAGSCIGTETCGADLAWSGCTAAVPADEICNGVDDDCDGLADNDLPATQPCTRENASGACAGLERCVGTTGWVCDAREPAVDVCNFADDDCDGATDEDFRDGAGRYTTPEHCGTCGNGCAGKYPLADQIVCASSGTTPECVVAACQPGTFQLSLYQCVIPPDAACKPCATGADCFGAACIAVQGANVCAYACTADSDCDAGLACVDGHCLPPNGTCDCDAETDGAKKSCSKVNGVGTCYGFQTCDADAGWSACDARTAASEICDGLDNDCNGQLDDALVAPACDSQLGICAGAVRICGGGAGWLPCSSATLPPTWESTELTCDGKDNDCDGQSDEAPNGSGPLQGAPCALSSGVCAGVKNVCQGGGYLGCSYGAAYQANETLCDGKDNDCNGLTDDVDVDGDGFRPVACGGIDCDDGNPTTNPSVKEDCSTPADEDCSGEPNDRDADGDGFLAVACGGDDCDDDRPTVSPIAVETCGNSRDDDCSGIADDRDLDQDGYRDLACGGNDCNDLSPLIFPGAAELCGDGVDNECNGKAEDKDTDKDGTVDVACGGTDCNDKSALSKPGLAEVCGDGLDNDCNGSIDDKDIDADSFKDPACGGKDCDDLRDDVHPGHPELCDGRDNDCNLGIDDKDADQDGHKDVACGGDDCRDSDPYVNPGADELCGDLGKVDEDCSGQDGDRDLDGDGRRDAACIGGTDCDDGDPLVYPAATEIYDTKDSDCDGTVDEGLVPAGALVITELMADPKAVDDSLGEYIEVTNVSGLPVNLASFTFADLGSPKDQFTVPVSPPLVIQAGGRAVLCRNANGGSNGGIPCDVDYENFQLANTSDELVLTLAGVEIDRVAYPVSGWPSSIAGAAWQLDPAQYSRLGNDTGGNWCNTPLQTLTSGGDRGSPGLPNPSCSGKPAVTNVSPNTGVDNGSEVVTVTGSGFTGATAVTFGTNPCAAYQIVSDSEIKCTTPAGKAGDVSVTVTKASLSGALAAAYRYTGEAVTGVDWCTIQWPPSVAVKGGDATTLLFGRTHATALPAAGQPTSVIGQVGYGPLGSDPRNDAGWLWVNAVWSKDVDVVNDEFRQTLTVDVLGTFAYGWRFTGDGGFNFMYCDLPDGTSNGFQLGELGELTVF